MFVYIKKMAVTASPLFLPVKLLGISYVTIIYFVLGFSLAKVLDYIVQEFDSTKENNKPVWQIFLEIFFRLSVLGILIYVSRNLVGIIPFPLQGVAGFDYFRLKELDNEFIFTIPIFIFHTEFNEKLKNLYARITQTQQK